MIFLKETMNKISVENPMYLLYIHPNTSLNKLSNINPKSTYSSTNKTRIPIYSNTLFFSYVLYNRVTKIHKN